MGEPNYRMTEGALHPDTLQDVADVDALIEALGDNDGLVRHHARVALVHRGSSAVPALLSALEAPDSNVRWEAARVLREIGDSKAAPSLVRALEDEGFDVRWIAAEGLIGLEQNALLPLLTALVRLPPSVPLVDGAHHVLDALRQEHRLPAAAEPVLAALEGPEPAHTVLAAAQTALRALDGASDGANRRVKNGHEPGPLA